MSIKIPVQTENVIIRLSGGADSALLLWMICDEWTKAKKPLSSTQKLDQEMNEIIGMSGYGEIEPGPKTDLTKVPDFILQMMGTAETRAELNKRKENEKSKS